MSDQPQIEVGGGSDASWTPRQITILKKAVAIMSVILVAGLIVVAGRIAYLTQQSGDAPIATSPPARMQEAVKLALPAGATIRNIALDGARLAIHYDAAGGGAIAVLDLASGHVVSRVSLVASQKAK